jgi:hypothetical protein
LRQGAGGLLLAQHEGAGPAQQAVAQAARGREEGQRRHRVLTGEVHFLACGSGCERGEGQRQGKQGGVEAEGDEGRRQEESERGDRQPEAQEKGPRNLDRNVPFRHRNLSTLF